MGNTCCPPKKQAQTAAVARPSNSDEVSRDMEYQLFGISFIVKTGDTTKEQADGLVTGLDNQARNRSNSSFSSAVVEQMNILVENERKAQANSLQLKNGEVVVTSSSSNLKNVSTVFHLAVPVWRGGQFAEIQTLQQSFVKVLEIASERSLSSVMFSDIGGNLFGIPKQLSAQALFEAIKAYGQGFNKSNEQSRIKQIKFIHKDPRTVSLFDEIVRKELGIKSDRAESAYIDILQGSKTYDQSELMGCQMEDQQKNLKERLLPNEKDTTSSTPLRKSTNDTL